MDKVISFRLYVPVKILKGRELFMCDGAGKIRVYTTREKLVKNIKDYDFIYCYDLTLKGL